MPIYEYRCHECQQYFEEWQKGFNEREIGCPVCGGKSQRIISNTSFVLKGGGWYVTDYASKSAKTTCAAKAEGGAHSGHETSGNENKTKLEAKTEVSSSPGSDIPACKAADKPTKACGASA